MTREEKAQIIQQLSDKLAEFPHFYLADTSAMTVEDINKFRGKLFDKGLDIRVVKNTLLNKAFEQHDGKFDKAMDVLKGTTAVVFTETANLPAKVLSDFRKGKEKPILKAAYIDESIFIGDDQLKALSELKSKEELLGEIIGLLQSPAKNVVSALQSSGGKLAGILKTLSEREN